MLLFFVGGAMVEFWWPAIVLTVAAWRYVRKPGWASLVVWIGATAALYVVNRNLWALAALPLIFLAPLIEVAVPRIRHVFYVFYPLHLFVLWNDCQGDSMTAMLEWVGAPLGIHDLAVWAGALLSKRADGGPGGVGNIRRRRDESGI